MTPGEITKVTEDAHALLEKGDYADAMHLGSLVLNEEPGSPEAVFICAMAVTRSSRWGLAYNLYKRFIELKPDIPEGWNNLGHVCQQMGRFEEAEGYLNKALELAPNSFQPLSNLASHEANQCRPWKAIYWGKKAMKFAKTDVEREQLKCNLALPYLALRMWPEGWDGFEYDNNRKAVKSYGIPKWDGTKGKTLVVHGEQGIGDEIMFSSMVPDAAKENNIIIDCDPRLEGLFRRSFPYAKVYGTRRVEADWLETEKPDAYCAIGSLGKVYRSKGEFPKTPYLIPDPERRLQWRALLDTLPGKKIGLAWTGGTTASRARERSLTLEQLKPVLETGHTFVSLQYKGEAGQGVHHWKRAVQTDDYDDTAALVAELDCVVSVTTAVALLCGAIGTKCHVLIPDFPTWHWGHEGDMPWFPLELHRKNGREWGAVINKVASLL